ncbi:MAG: UDP-N-acetylmuramoyl-tripeptide--D-alanyl-D-alanine ligase [Rikenellaceae bacterium]|nr:UDP-N-acetylmuramoyl-tripeptide--D-alanyl-D-alanine ligase [Rikenellaceae bacterium]
MAAFYADVAAMALLLFYVAVAAKYELQMLQQNSYRVRRYWKWLRGDLMSMRRLIDLLILGVLLVWGANPVVAVLAGVAMAARALALLRRKYKKPLVFTARARRLYATAVALTVGSTVPVLFTADADTAVVVAALWCVLPCVAMILATWLNMPVDRAMSRWYYNDAKRILAGMPGLVIVGITGSYGKTSTKHYLYRILSERYNVLMTPGSFNTTLGVIRTIREQLKSYHEVFIVEMGAKQIGDIREICGLVHPRIGIITAVGEQHLESFKTIENVQRTKFELIDALPADGVAILNNDFEYIANRPVGNVERVVRYGVEHAQADYRVEDIRYGASETMFTVVGGGERVALTTRLVGSCNLSNLLACYIAARQLGMTEREIALGAARIEQVEHRLSVKRTPGGITIIDDAFNSNPHGAKMALDVLKGFEAAQRVLVTPGLIELGTKQYAYNHRFGVQAASSCDYAIVVGKYNGEAIEAGLKEGGMEPGRIYRALTFTEATVQVGKIVRKGDVVLYENDLPDTFK